jgi:hypothetical protein
MLRKTLLTFVFMLTIALSSIYPAGLPSAAANLPGAPEGVVLITPRHVSLDGMMVHLTVTGSWFTPGGRVYIELLDQWGVMEGPDRWVTASEEIFGPNGSEDPAEGYVSGGTLHESFEYPCGSEFLLLALDATDNTWSSVVRVPHMACDF